MLKEKPSSSAELKKVSPRFLDLVCPKELLLAYKEAKALPHCTVVCDDLALRLSRMQKLKILLLPSKEKADVEKRMNEQLRE